MQQLTRSSYLKKWPRISRRASQSATSEEINISIEEINNIAGDTSSGMEQSASAVQDLSHMAQELRTLLDKLRS